MQDMMERANRKSVDVPSRQMDGVWWTGNCPSLYPEMCCPINVARGLFSCCNRSCVADVLTIVKEGEAHIVAVLALATCLHCERREQQAYELPLHDAIISSLMILLSVSLFFFFLIRMLYNTACSSLL